MKPLKIFIGWDPREVQAYHVLCHSIIEHTSVPVSITPLVQRQLKQAGLYWRAPDARASTEFSLTRFLVPHLCGYMGQALFLDCDMLVQDDLYQLFGLTKEQYDAPCFVVQHDYTPSTATKMDGVAQTVYPRKNWSSVMLFNNAQCNFLTPEYVNTATPAQLHQFEWAGDRELGNLPLEWNWLVGEYALKEDAKILHYTLGGPWFPQWTPSPEMDRWLAAWRSLS